jgi:indolepyruvate ferredoxin oxidoreductase beta subunit
MAEAQALVRGYGDTYERGLANFRRLAAAARALAGRSDAATALERLRRSALADERGEALGRELGALGLA